MKVCILGNGLTSLTLAKTLVNQGIYVDIFCGNKKHDQNKIQTLGISKSNIEFFNKNILNIKKLLWDINKIEIYSDNLNDEKILNFENQNEKLFSIIKNCELLNYLNSSLKKNKLFQIKINIKNFDSIHKNYDLVFNCDPDNQVSKKYFYRKITKNYKSFAYASIIHHKRLVNNNTALQIFTKKGPFAYLPISQTETSIVYSFKGIEDIDLKEHIKKYSLKYNSKYEINKIENPIKFKLHSSNLRSYHYKNILAFGDTLHKLHPLAGQGFNMSLRDIKEIFELIKFRINLGLPLDSSIFLDFENKTKHKNFIFSDSINFIYEYFNLEQKFNGSLLSKSVKFLGKNKILNKSFKKIADQGLII